MLKKRSSVRKLARRIEQGFTQLYPAMPEVPKRNLPLIVAAQIEVSTVNTAILTSYLPLEMTRSDLRDQGLRRQLSSKSLDSVRMAKPFATQFLCESAEFGQVIQLSMDRTDIGNRFAVLTIAPRIGERALPLIRTVESGAANIGFEKQKGLLEQVLIWISEGAPVRLSADRFYPSERQHHRQYRIRLKSNFLTDPGQGDLLTTGTLAQDYQERYEANVSLLQSEIMINIMINIGILHEPGHKEPWIIAIDCKPTRAAVLDYSSRWCTWPMFSDFKSRGFGLEDTRIEIDNRISINHPRDDFGWGGCYGGKAAPDFRPSSHSFALIFMLVEGYPDHVPATEGQFFDTGHTFLLCCLFLSRLSSILCIISIKSISLCRSSLTVGS